jgi:hypothetical protein
MCARTATMMLLCAGDGGLGQTGTGGGSYPILQEVIPGFTNWNWGPYIFDKTVVAAMTAAAPLNLRAWGVNNQGQGGAGNAGANLMFPTKPTYLPVPFAEYSIGRDHACGTDAAGSGQVFCIGDNTKGKHPIQPTQRPGRSVDTQNPMLPFNMLFLFLLSLFFQANWETARMPTPQFLLTRTQRVCLQRLLSMQGCSRPAQRTRTLLESIRRGVGAEEVCTLLDRMTLLIDTSILQTHVFFANFTV